MSLKFYSFIFFIGLSIHSFCQQEQSVISAAGDISKSSTLVLEWTLGELAVETGFAPNKMYTQGFHQPLLITKLKPANKSITGYTVSVYPNPVPAELTVNIQSLLDSKVYLQLLNLKGQVVYTNSTYSKGSTVKINMRSFASGVYLLTVTQSSGLTIGTYKIVKAS